jgi:hypothetical protein
MKQLKIIGLAVVAAMALTAFVGAGTASAATQICKVNTETPACSEANQYPSGTALKAGLKAGTSAKLTTAGALINPTITCTVSSVAGKTTANSGTPLPGEVTAMSFSGCTNSFNGKKCTPKTLNLPYPASVTTAASGIMGNGEMNVEDPSGAGVEMACEELPTCTYTTTAITLDVIGGTPAEVIANEEKLNKLSGISCPTEAKWTATYTVSEPSTLFVI